MMIIAMILVIIMTSFPMRFDDHLMCENPLGISPQLLRVSTSAPAPVDLSTCDRLTDGSGYVRVKNGED